MPRYVFILGREPELSVAEIQAVAARKGIRLKWNSITASVAILEKERTEGFFDDLAGTVKVAEVVGEVQTSKSALVDFLVRQLPAGERCEFGLSWYGERPLRWLMTAGLEVKKMLRQEDSHVRYVVSRESSLSSVVVQKNKLLPPQGFDFVLLPQNDSLLVARTVRVQDFEAWSQRDYGRPQRDARVGMLPPKLARMMVNLAQAPISGGVLDPFCGSGTVLQEAALLGYRHLVGADSDAKGVERTKANFVWLKEQHAQLIEPALVGSDIRKLPGVLQGAKFEAIVTEPYLGPPLRGHEDERRLRQIQGELIEFYHTALKVLSKLLKPGGRLVMVWPVIRVGKQEHPLPLMGSLREVELSMVDALPPEAPKDWHNDRGTLRYARPDARVGREIVVLQK